MTPINTYAVFRKNLLSQIVLARSEYYRLAAELTITNQPLPQGSYIGKYRSNYEWEYYTLGHKDAVFPSARDPEKLTQKRHLGLSGNPNYLQSLLHLEATRVYQIKFDTLQGVGNHLLALKRLWRSHRENFQKTKREMKFKVNRKNAPDVADFVNSFGD